jgi:hypothetical protein
MSFEKNISADLEDGVKPAPLDPVNGRGRQIFIRMRGLLTADG